MACTLDPMQTAFLAVSHNSLGLQGRMQWRARLTLCAACVSPLLRPAGTHVMACTLDPMQTACMLQPVVKLAGMHA